MVLLPLNGTYPIWIACFSEPVNPLIEPNPMGLDSSGIRRDLDNVDIHYDLENLPATADYYDHVPEAGSIHPVGIRVLFPAMP